MTKKVSFTLETVDNYGLIHEIENISMGLYCLNVQWVYTF